MYWGCKHHQSKETRTPPPVTYTAPQSPNMSTPRMGAIGADQNSAPGQVTVGFWEPVGEQRMVTDYQMQNAFATALLDQLEDLCSNVTEPHRRLRPRQYSAVPQIEN